MVTVLSSSSSTQWWYHILVAIIVSEKFCSFHTVGQPCAQQNVFNITDSQTLTTTASCICLACLFNGATLSTSSTEWTAFGLPITFNQDVALVNPNGTLLITLQSGAANDMQFSCQSKEVVFNIIVSCESHVFFNCSPFKYLYYAAMVSQTQTLTAGELYALLIISCNNSNS